MRITFKRLVEKGVKLLKVKSIDGIASHKNLPVEYLATRPYLYMSNNILMIYSGAQPPVEIKVNDVISEHTRNFIVEKLKICGERLYEINKKVAILKKEFNGIEVYEF